MAENGDGKRSVKDGFLTEEQREVMKIAVQKAEVKSALTLSSSPKSLSGMMMMPEQPMKSPSSARVPAFGGGVGGAKHVRRSHSGKVVRVKKGNSVSVPSSFHS